MNNLKSIRDGFGEALIGIGEKDEKIVVLTADLAESTRVNKFRDKFPDRFFEVGVAEQALVTVAAGMAAAGKIPFTTSYAVFSPGRTFEQIKVTACLNDLPVKIIGAHAGFGAAMYGATHESLEDIALMRVLPGMVVDIPGDYEEAKKAVNLVARNGRPSYLRLARQKSEVFSKAGDGYEIGKAKTLYEGRDPQVAIVGCGPLLSEALSASRELSKNGIETIVFNNHTVKPMDELAIIRAAKTCGAVITIEDHQIQGGMGSAVAEVLGANFPVPIEFMGATGFAESGTVEEMNKKFGLTEEGIIEAVKKAILRKNS
jgi:transketolase